MIVDVSDKVIVITGASRGIGRELAKAFAKENAKVVINYFNSEVAASHLLEEIRLFNPNCIKVKADVTNRNDVTKLFQETIDSFGKVDVLINNAGVCDDNSIQLMSEKQWSEVININLTGAFLCSQVFSKMMIQQEYGKIINIASLKGQEGCELQVNYAASKAGLIGFTKSLAKDLGRFNVAVNAICPGFIVTDLNRNNEEKVLIAMKKNQIKGDTALFDLINFILFFCSDGINGVSGRVFNLDSRIQ